MRTAGGAALKPECERSRFVIVDGHGAARRVSHAVAVEALRGCAVCADLHRAPHTGRTYSVLRCTDADSMHYVRPHVNYAGAACTFLFVVRHPDGWSPRSAYEVFDARRGDHLVHVVDLDDADVAYCATAFCAAAAAGRYDDDCGHDPEQLLRVWMRQRKAPERRRFTVSTRRNAGVKWGAAMRIGGKRVAATSNVEAVAYWFAFGGAARPAFRWDADGYARSRCRTAATMRLRRRRAEPMVRVDADGTTHEVVERRYVASLAFDCRETTCT